MDSYSRLDKLLHRFVLSYDFLGEALFDIEKYFFLDKLVSLPPHKNVFVAGLARAGTTTLMRALYSSDEFASLTYRDMPFVMAINCWQRVSGRFKKKSEKKERAHGDGVLVDFDSPEAFEEVFWRVYDADNYISEEYLKGHHVLPDVLEQFTAYIALICKRYGKKRYLSKNNNNILRIDSLSTHMESSVFLVPFRQPMDQAYSLLQQHQHFYDSSSFVRDYMKWLSHFEFGPNHRPFRLSHYQPKFTDPCDINYWLEIWMHVYSCLLSVVESKRTNIFFISYERLCIDCSYWKSICDLVDIPHNEKIVFEAPKRDLHMKVDQNLSSLAKNLYEKCEQLSHRVGN